MRSCGWSSRLSRALESEVFPSIVSADFTVLLPQGILNDADKLFAAMRQAAHCHNSVALGVVICNHESLSVGFESIGSSLYQIVSCFAFFGIEDLNAMRGNRVRGAWGSAGSIENYRERCAGRIPVLSEDFDQFIACSGRMPWFVGSEISPGMKEAEAIHQNTGNCHSQSVKLISKGDKWLEKV